MENLATLITPVYPVSIIRKIEAASFSAEGDSYPMMQRAAHSLYLNFQREFEEVCKCTVLCGGGNNGGDGALLAVLLANEGLEVAVYDLSVKPRVGDAQRAWEELLASDANVFASTSLDDAVEGHGVIVDAMLGIGGIGELIGEYDRVCSWVNRSRDSGARVLAVDSPTGLNSDTGWAVPNAVVADLTVTFVRDKPGFYINQGLVHSGKVICDRLNSVSLDTYESRLFVFDAEKVARISPCLRRPLSHKGDYGHIAVIGGDYGYGGAVLMAGMAATRSGAGTVAVATRERHIAPLLARCPSVMAISTDDFSIEALLRGDKTVLIVGPGLGRGNWGNRLFGQAFQMPVCKILDADALYWLANVPNKETTEKSVLTPHPGEAARLLGTSVEEILQDVIGSAQAISALYGAVVILKGPSSVIAHPDGRVVVTGNPCPALAKGGSGDVLTGVLASCIAYYGDLFEAAVIAVAWHNSAALRASDKMGSISMQPYELLEYLE